MPRFSIIITCHNQRRFIRQAVESSLAQTSPDKEVIVVDDGSVDGSKAILEHYAESVLFKPLAENRGANAARNCGAALASGDYLVFLDGDDIMFPWALTVYGRIVESKKPALILTQLLWFKDTGTSVNSGDVPKAVDVVEFEYFMKKDRAFRASASATVVGRTLFDKVGGWAEDIFPLEDVDLVVKLGYSGRMVQIINPPTTAYRVHGDNTIHQLPRMLTGVYKILEKEKKGQYPGGKGTRFERRGVIGGVIFFWIRRAFRGKLYAEGLRLLASGLPMVICAMMRRFVAVARGRQRVERIMLKS